MYSIEELQKRRLKDSRKQARLHDIDTRNKDANTLL